MQHEKDNVQHFIHAFWYYNETLIYRAFVLVFRGLYTFILIKHGNRG